MFIRIAFPVPSGNFKDERFSSFLVSTPTLPSPIMSAADPWGDFDVSLYKLPPYPT